MAQYLPLQNNWIMPRRRTCNNSFDDNSCQVAYSKILPTGMINVTKNWNTYILVTAFGRLPDIMIQQKLMVFFFHVSFDVPQKRQRPKQNTKGKVGTHLLYLKLRFIILFILSILQKATFLLFFRFSVTKACFFTNSSFL